MKYFLYGLLACLFVAAGCDKPDEVYKDLPRNYDPEIGNGTKDNSTHFDGEKSFEDETAKSQAGGSGVVSVEVCTDAEAQAAAKTMVQQKIIPMQGAGGIDMRGGESWAGLTIDDAQHQNVLCQAGYYGDGIAAWGDQFEFIVFFDSQTKKINGIATQPGYLGTLDAGKYVFEMNEPIRRDGLELNAADGTSFDPKSDENLRDINRELVKMYRTGIEDPDSIDCVSDGSCYIMMSGTMPVMVFMNTGVYVILEPSEQRIAALQLTLKRPFRLGMGQATVNGLSLNIKGTAPAGIPNCDISIGTTWGHIKENCLGGDNMAMAEITAVYTFEYILVKMGGVLLYFQRPDLPDGEILDEFPALKDTDAVHIVSINSEYEGKFSMPYSTILKTFKENVQQEIRNDLKLAEDELTGVEYLRTPDDPYLPVDNIEISTKYKDQLRPGGIFAVFCSSNKDKVVLTGSSDIDGGVDTDTEPTVYQCYQGYSGKYLRPLITTLIQYVAATLKNKTKEKYTDSSFYVQHFQRAMATYFNGGPVIEDQMNFLPSASYLDTIYTTISIAKEDKRYTINSYYSGNDDRMHFLNFGEGGSRQEAILYEDAKRNAGKVFNFRHLQWSSEALGVGKVGTVKVVKKIPETRRAVLEITMDGGSKNTVIAQYQDASNVVGYSIPRKGYSSKFVPADWFSLGGGTISAGFYMLPEEIGSSKNQIVAVSSGAFFSHVYWCGYKVRLGEPADELIQKVADSGYNCETIVNYSENREFVTSMADMDSKLWLSVSNNQVTSAFAWLR